VLKRKVTMKLPSHRLGLAGTLVLYGITMGEKGSIDEYASLV